MPKEQHTVINPPETRPPTPKMFLLDLGNVFLAADHEITHEHLHKQLGVTPERAATFFLGSPYGHFSRGAIDEHAFSDALRQRLKSPLLTNQQLREAHDRHIYGLIPGMKKLLEELRRIHGKSAIVFVTDTNPWQTAGQQELIDLSNYRVFTSDEIGMLKSDPEITDDEGHKRNFFSLTLGQLKIQPGEALLIDDSPEKVAVAQRYGIQTIQFETIEQLVVALEERSLLGTTPQ